MRKTNQTKTKTLLKRGQFNLAVVDFTSRWRSRLALGFQLRGNSLILEPDQGLCVTIYRAVFWRVLSKYDDAILGI